MKSFNHKGSQRKKHKGTQREEIFDFKSFVFL